MTGIYLDHAATTPLAPEVLEAMRPYLTGTFGNPSSPHRFGREARKAVEDARERVASLLGARARDVTFTSGGTESDNLAMFGAAHARAQRGRHILASAIEHKAVLEPLAALGREGFDVERIPVDARGLVDPAEVERRLRDDTTLVSVMHVNNEIGTIQPIAGIARAVHARGAWLHTDAVQGAGKVPFTMATLGADLVSISAHKLSGPKGVGALVLAPGIRVAPRQLGGDHEFARRAGTEAVAPIVGLAEALAVTLSRHEQDAPRIRALRDRLESRLLSGIHGATVRGHPEHRVYHILNLTFTGVAGDALTIALDQEGIAVTAGSACNSEHVEPSHVIRALGVPDDLSRGALRFSLGRDTTQAEVDAAADATARAVRRLRDTAA